MKFKNETQIGESLNNQADSEEKLEHLGEIYILTNFYKSVISVVLISFFVYRYVKRSGKLYFQEHVILQESKE